MKNNSIELMLAKLVDLYNFDTATYRRFINIYETCKDEKEIDIKQTLEVIDSIRKDKAENKPLAHLSKESLGIEYALLQKHVFNGVKTPHLLKKYNKYAKEIYIKARFDEKSIAQSLSAAQSGMQKKHSNTQRLFAVAGLCMGFCWLAGSISNNPSYEAQYAKSIKSVYLKVKNVLQR